LEKVNARFNCHLLCLVFRLVLGCSFESSDLIAEWISKKYAVVSNTFMLQQHSFDILLPIELSVIFLEFEQSICELKQLLREMSSMNNIVPMN